MRKKIIIVEDDPVVARIYEQKYLGMGFDVETTQDGQAGLEKIRSWRPDLVQTDLMMPKMNGVELIRAVRTDPAIKDIPIIVLSNAYVSDMVRDAWKSGANKVISKMNCTPKVLLEFINELLPSTPPPAPAPVAMPVPVPVAQAAPPAPPVAYAAPVQAGAGPQVVYECNRSMVQEELRQDLLKRVPQFEANLRNQMHAFIRSEQESDRLHNLGELHATTRSLSSFAGVTGLIRLSHMAGALEILLRDLNTKPKNINASTIRTITHAVDRLRGLLSETVQGQDSMPADPLILAVDDEPISRRTLCTALGKANLRVISLDSPTVALRVLAENKFDLIFLDVSMPEMDGFELCRKLRELSSNRLTPVIFVTSLTDFLTKTQSTLSGGNDLIAKPFLLIELAVKALTVILKAKPVAPVSA